MIFGAICTRVARECCVRSAAEPEGSLAAWVWEVSDLAGAPLCPACVVNFHVDARRLDMYVVCETVYGFRVTVHVTLSSRLESLENLYPLAPSSRAAANKSI